VSARELGKGRERGQTSGSASHVVVRRALVRYFPAVFTEADDAPN
jgi:hypothetical protein